MFCTIWYHLYYLKNVKNTHGGMSFLVKLQAYITKSDTHVDGSFEFLINISISFVFHLFVTRVLGSY